MRNALAPTGIAPLDDLIATLLDRISNLRELDKRYQAVPPSKDPAEFIDLALSALDVAPEVHREELRHLPLLGPAIVCANHPFGAIEGLLIAHVILNRRRDLRILANAHLHRVCELRELLIGVDPFEGKGAIRENVQPLREAIRWVRDGGTLLMFPSGEVSHLQLRRVRVTDREWRPSVSQIARKADAPVVPVFVSGRNSWSFHILGCLHPRLRTALLPRELVNKLHRRVPIQFGPPVNPKRLDVFPSYGQSARYLRLRTYSLAEVRRDRTLPPGSTSVTQKNRRRPIAARCEGRLLEAEFEALPDEQKLVRGTTLQTAYARPEQIHWILRELGRLRELAFRNVGEGTGKAADIDKFDSAYCHLFLWNSERREIAGAYRFALVDEILSMIGKHGLYTYSLFTYGRRFTDGLHQALELGRSFVHPDYQRSYAALMLLWQGIGRFVARNPRYHRLFGPVSISNDYHPVSRQFIVDFLLENRLENALARDVRPRTGLRRRPKTFWRREDLADILDIDAVSDVVERLEGGERGLPILLRQYLKLGGVLLGFNVDRSFGNVLDGLILVDLLKTDRSVLQRYMGKSLCEVFFDYHARQPAGGDTAPGHCAALFQPS